MKRSSLLAFAVCCALLVQVASAAAALRPGLDRGYGSEGVANIGAGSQGPVTQAWAAARDGSVFVLRSAWDCGASPCGRTLTVQRYGSDGQLDQAFAGSGTLKLAQGLTTSSRAGLAVDAEGRLLAAWWADGSTVVARFDSSGNPDASFGSSGAARFGCQCGEGEGSAGVIPLADGKILLRQTSSSYRSGTGEGLMIWRLRSSGALDGSYGDGGGVPLSYQYGLAPTIFRARSNGSLLLARGSGCCGSSPYMARLSASGKLVRGFTANAEHSLQALPRGSRRAETTSVVLHPDGRIDVLGGSGGGGFIFRLLANGRRQRDFGKRGLMRLAWPVAAATRDAGDGTFVVSAGNSSGIVAHRIFADGKVDRRFGGGFGVPALDVPIVNGLETTALPGGRALVFVGGYPECRLGNCEQQSRLVMFREPSMRFRR